MEQYIYFKDNTDLKKQKKLLKFFELKNLFIEQTKLDLEDKKI